MPIVLASASPRRRELLLQAGVPFVVRPADLDETVLAGETPIAYVRRLAEQKARAVAATDTVKSLDYFVLGADTTVVCGDTILGKPADADEADAMLRQLSGRAHEVTTGFCVLGPAVVDVQAVTTRVVLREILPDERAAYVRSREWDGKAGGYAIQGLAGALVERIEGSYSNVVGLPICEVLIALRAHGALPQGWQLGGNG